ncbi:MAG: arsenate reductase ArsC [Candidatus Neomarinimicrobiota bacterium]
MNRRLKVLFLCTGNSCRSQMAEGLLRYLAGERFEVFSAGTHPSRVHPLAIAVMTELGIDISGHRSDPLEKYLDAAIDIVITVCDDARAACPLFPGSVKYQHWSTADPFRGWEADLHQLPVYRQTRDSLKQRIIDFIVQPF